MIAREVENGDGASGRPRVVAPRRWLASPQPRIVSALPAWPAVEVAALAPPPARVRVLGRVLPDAGARPIFAGTRAIGLGSPSPGSLTSAPVCDEFDGGALPPPATSRCTPIRPPRELVKYEDRLHYFLQPPLEYLLSSERLKLPFAPFPYQLQGIAFLYPRDEAVLADEMGLGKTMQTAVAIRLLARLGRVRRALLACPKPLVTNWRRELAQWAPELPVTIVEGSQSQREWLWRHATEGVLLVNYELLVRDRQLASEVDPPFDLAVIDEAQRIKNHSGATSEAVRAIPRRRSWALTGTPIENSADDLVGIFEFVAPGRLRPQMRPAAIRQAVADHVLRRTKDQVLSQLPPKMFCDAQLPLAPEQQETYQRAEEEGIVRIHALGPEVTIRHVFQLVIRLKQICNFDPLTDASAKLDRLEADLEECAASGRKAIVFSQWVATLDKIAARLTRFGPLQYHGRIPPAQRDAVIERFRDDPQAQVLLMSYGAGSVGLNLQFASYVFLFDRWWNPAVEDQAINRAHRIGAAGPVTVTRFVAAGTIEERINRILEEKRALFDAVFGGPNPLARRGLTTDEIFGLFDLPPAPHAAAA